MKTLYWRCCALFAAAAIALGAFGAHALRAWLTPEQLAIYQTAVQYQMYHALGLGLIAALQDRLGTSPSRRLAWAGGLMLAGIVLFSGSLYALVFTGFGWLGWITPCGGISLIAAWLVMACVGFDFSGNANRYGRRGRASRRYQTTLTDSDLTIPVEATVDSKHPDHNTPS